jgi:hypothetical protein
MSNVENNLTVDPSPFGPNFKDEMNRIVADEVKEIVFEKTAKTAAVAVPSLLLLTGCTSKDGLNLDHNQTVGLVSGGLCALEETFEKDTKKNFGKIVASIASKFGAGYMAGYAISHNSQNGSWLSEENLTTTISLIPSAYVLFKETSFSQLADTFVSSVQNKTAASKASREEEHTKREINHLLNQAYSANLKASNEARQKLMRMGINDRLRQRLHDGTVDLNNIKFS